MRKFSVTLTIDGEEIPIAEVAERLRDAAAVRYQFDFDGDCFATAGKVRLDFCMRAQNKQDRLALQTLLRADGGKAFFEFLNAKMSRGRPPGLTFHANSKWFVSFKYQLHLSELGGARLAEGAPASPGPFQGEVDYLLLDSEDSSGHIWDSLSDYRSYVSELSGIRVYRNGFGIRVGEDWLNLGRQQTSGGSMYGLRPKNVIGYVSIDARENRALLETTSREGFQKTAHYSNFYSLLQQFVDWSSLAQEYLRRGALEFLRHHRASEVGIKAEDSLESATQRLRSHAKEIDDRERSFVNARNSVRIVTEDARSRLDIIVGDDEQFSLYHQDKIEMLNELINTVGEAFQRVQSLMESQQSEATSIARAQQILEVILEREEKLQQELAMFYEGVALGLTAEALSHEISSIADRLSNRSAALRRHIGNQPLRDDKTLAFVEHVRASVTALRKQLAHLDPSLRYVREQRAKLVLAHELKEAQDFFMDRLGGAGISMKIVTLTPFTINMNKGKLNQIFDNLVLNSEYWLRETKRRDSRFAGIITVELDSPFLRFWDNGPGVAISVEETLFDPFITTKGRSGRGLGLFIVRQLLDAEGCSIGLRNERNEEGRRFKFEIDLQGALYE